MSGRSTSTTAALGRSVWIRSSAVFPLPTAIGIQPSASTRRASRFSSSWLSSTRRIFAVTAEDDTGGGAPGQRARKRGRPPARRATDTGVSRHWRIRHGLPPRTRPCRCPAPHPRRLRAEEARRERRPRRAAGRRRAGHEDLVRPRRLADRRRGHLRRLDRQGREARDRGAEREGRCEGEAARPQDLRRPGQARGGGDRRDAPHHPGQGGGAARRGRLEPLARDGPHRGGEQGPDDLAVVNAYSVGLADYFLSKFKELGGTIVNDQSYKAGDQDFKAQLTAIKAKGPEAIYVPGYYTDVALIARQARELGMKAPLMGGDGWDSAKLFEIGGAAIEGSFFSNHYSPEDPSPRIQDFIKRYKARFGAVPDSMAATGYDAAMVAADGLARAKDATGDAAAEAIAATKDFPGVTGVITLDKDHNAVKPAVVLEVKGGKAVYVSTVAPDAPAPAAAAPMTAPNPIPAAKPAGK